MGKAYSTQRTKTTWGKNLLHRTFGVTWLQLPGDAGDSIQAYNEYYNGKQMRQQLPVIITLLESLVQEIGDYSYAAKFDEFLSLIGVITQVVQVLQGQRALERVLQGIGVKISGDIEAQTCLQSPRFAKQVYHFIHQRIQETLEDDVDHLFFVYHPDTDWYPRFVRRVESDPLPTNFLGMSSNLDTLCIWLLFVRSLLAQSDTKRESHLHILVPAYRPLIIKDPIKFPREIYPLTIEGHIHNSIFQVWLNIPDLPEDGMTLRDVGNLAAPPTFWQQWAEPLQSVTACSTWLAGGSAAMGLSAAAASVAAPLALPVFIVGASAAMYGTVTATNAVRDGLTIPEPRLLGGNINRRKPKSQRRKRRVGRRHTST